MFSYSVTMFFFWVSVVKTCFCSGFLYDFVLLQKLWEMFLPGRFQEVDLLKCLNCVCYYFYSWKKFILNIKMSFFKYFYLFRKQPQLPHWIEFFLGMKPRGIKETVCPPTRVSPRDQEWYDAEIARKLQEEELLVGTFKIKVQAKS